MRDELLEVIALQRQYTRANSPAMQQRGQLIRHKLPDELRIASAQLRAALGRYGDDLAFEGRDGTGHKTIIPWVRFYSEGRSPSAQNGWYCVYLFDAPGTGVYLELGHGSTTLEGGDYRPRPPEVLAKLVSWGREVLKPVIQADPTLAQPVSLSGGKLGNAYERSALIAKWYSEDGMPRDEVLYADAVAFAGYLKLIYDSETLGLVPGDPSPELIAVQSAVAGPLSRHGGQWFGLTAAERRAVEMQAMKLAREYLHKDKWTVRDVSSQKPYDFECTRDVAELIVEVKGTTSHGEQIVLTKNELDAHLTHHPNNWIS
jgi:hypothetical protein